MSVEPGRCRRPSCGHLLAVHEDDVELADMAGACRVTDCECDATVEDLVVVGEVVELDEVEDDPAYVVSRRIAFTALGLAVLAGVLLVAAFAFGVAAVWTTGGDLSSNLADTAGLCLAGGVVSVGLATLVAREVPSSDDEDDEDEA